MAAAQQRPIEKGFLLQAFPALEPHAKRIEVGSAIAGFFVAIASVIWFALKQTGLPFFLLPFFAVDIFLTKTADSKLHHLLCIGALLPAALFATDFSAIFPYLYTFVMMEISTIFLDLFWFHDNGVVAFPNWLYWVFKIGFIVLFFKFRIYDFTKALFSPATYEQILTCFAGSNLQVFWQYLMGFGIGGLNFYWGYRILKGLARLTGLLPGRPEAVTPIPLKLSEKFSVQAEPTVSTPDAPPIGEPAHSRSSSPGNPELE